MCDITPLIQKRRYTFQITYCLSFQQNSQYDRPFRTHQTTHSEQTALRRSKPNQRIAAMDELAFQRSLLLVFIVMLPSYPPPPGNILIDSLFGAIHRFIFRMLILEAANDELTWSRRQNPNTRADWN